MNGKKSDTVQAPDREAPSALPSSRRQFLRTAALGVAGGSAALATGCEYRSQLFLLGRAPTTAEKASLEWQEARVRSYRPLGHTGMQMSDISFGCSGLDNVAVVKRALERGVNYFDTSPDYSRAGSEHTLGEGIKGYPREKLFVVSKFCTPDGHLSNDTPVKDVIAAVEASLQRLGVEYLDLAHIHACDSLNRLMNPNIHEAFDRLKEQGKLRFLGVSSHTPHLETVMRHAVDCGRFDVIMVAYNFKNWPDLSNIFRAAKEKGVGVVAMKTLKGARHTALADFTPSERESFAQAAFKWVLSNQDVSGLVVSINSLAQIDEYLHASGRPLQQADADLLEKYDRLVANDYCRPGCGACLSSCPYEVPIDDVLRYAMYYENYGQQRLGMEAYARLPVLRNASRCVNCQAPCQPACPFELSVKDKLLRAD
ncbi:MAG TPA: aldo/keto reductase, partial [Candidatus Binatia bacterium]|nr:aldo/keto reductase [Candidatus Binatia bacterium]